MLPVRDFRRRRRRPFAALGQPLIGFWLAALLVQAAAQPHAREHHAQHIMNQARAHQKACGCSVSSQSRRARSAERHAVEQYITSHRWRAGLANVAEWRRVAGAGPTHERHERRRTRQQREWQRRKHEEGKKATKADNLKAQRQARKDLLKRKRDLAKRKKERDRRKRSVASAYGEL